MLYRLALLYTMSELASMNFAPTVEPNIYKAGSRLVISPLLSPSQRSERSRAHGRPPRAGDQSLLVLKPAFDDAEMAHRRITACSSEKRNEWISSYVVEIVEANTLDDYKNLRGPVTSHLAP